MNSPDIKSALALKILNLIPPLIRESLFEEPNFLEEYGLPGDPIFSIGDSGVSIRCSHLSDAIKEILSGAPEKEIVDMDGRKWTLKGVGETEESLNLSLTCGEQCLPLSNPLALSPNRDTRLRFFDEASSRYNLPSNVSGRWRNALSERALEGMEINAFYSDLAETPIQKAHSISSEIVGGWSNISSLVPPSRRYFERLVGVYDGSSSIQDYASGVGKTFLNQLSAWRPYDGFLYSLFLSSHSCIPAEISASQLSSKDLVRAFDFLDKRGDRISQLGAIEVGLRVLPSMPEIETSIIRLIEQIRDDDAAKQESGFNLLSALFFLVDGQLSGLRLLSEEPPFYRRLAALSQAALIHRQLVKFSGGIGKFSKWAYDNFGGQYYLQSLTDMRLEPRWNPIYSTPTQIKADFFGRIMITAMKYKKNIEGSKIHDLVLGNDAGSLQSLSDSFRPYLPGPLEGTENTQIVLPADWAKEIEAQLGTEEVELSSFISLVNSAMIFRIGGNHAELAVKALRGAKYRLLNIESKSKLISTLDGLAAAAAVSRNSALADELRILVRVYRHDAKYALSTEEAMRFCLVAAASRADLDDWADFVGDWLTELAFSDLENDEGAILHSHLKELCRIVPELWATCSRADAALTAFNAI